MRVFKTAQILFSYFQFIHSFNPLLYKSIDPIHLRKVIRDNLLENNKFLSWKKAKMVLHDEINQINIYGESPEQNVEHVVPQSLFKTHNEKKLMKVDLHNLFLSSANINSCRKNFKYLDNSELSIISAKQINNFKPINHLGLEIKNLHEYIHQQNRMMLLNKKDRYFIPCAESRGKISRSIAYFVIRYDSLDILNDVINVNTLIEWNQKYPVDKNEYLKNIVIAKYQNVYNPFVIYPELLIYAFSDQLQIDIDQMIDQKNTVHTINYLIDQMKEREKYINLLKKTVGRPL